MVIKMVRRRRKATRKPRKKYGKIGAPRSAKRKAHMRRISRMRKRRRR